VLHDGPAVRNADIHIGTAVQQDPEGHRRQSKTLAGFDAPYVRLDCHGMPIEVQIEKKYGRNLPPEETLRLCRAFALGRSITRRRTSSALG